MGNFPCLSSADLLKINSFKKFFKESYQCVKQFGSRSGQTNRLDPDEETDILSVLIWVQTVCKGYQ